MDNTREGNSDLGKDIGECNWLEIGDRPMNEAVL